MLPLNLGCSPCKPKPPKTSRKCGIHAQGVSANCISKDLLSKNLANLRAVLLAAPGEQNVASARARRQRRPVARRALTLPPKTWNALSPQREATTSLQKDVRGPLSKRTTRGPAQIPVSFTGTAASSVINLCVALRLLQRAHGWYLEPVVVCRFLFGSFRSFLGRVAPWHASKRLKSEKLKTKKGNLLKRRLDDSGREIK